MTTSKPTIVAAILLYTLFAPLPAMAQDYSYGTPLSEGQFKPQAPDVWAMIKYGDRTNVGLNSGAASFSIPIYTYEDSDFKIPLSIDYNCDGFKPSSNCGVVGYGWSLMAGGVITREVRGIPDEVRQRVYPSKREGDHSVDDVYAIAQAAQCPPGMLKQMIAAYNALNSNYVDGYARCYAATLPLDSLDYAYSGEMGKEYMLCRKITGTYNEYVEVEPDIYHYSFPGYSGSFILGKSGEVTLLNSSTPAGEIGITYDYRISTPLYGSFTIKTGDGTKYIFGYTDFADSFTEYVSDNGEHSVSSWRLTRIESRSGRQAQFGYSETGNTANSISVTKAVSIDHLTLTDSKGTVTKTWENNDNLSSDTDQITNYTTSGLLERITVPGRADIKLSYSMHSEQRLLDSIIVKNMSGNLVKSCLTEYDIKIGSVAVLLKSVTIPGEGVYGMSYYDESSNNFPDKYAGNDDWYGYYSHSIDQPVYSNGSLSAYSSTLMSARSNYDFYRTRMALLKTITYPTGGGSEYTYEQNDYSYDGNASSSYKLRSNHITSGLRVKRIDNFDQSGTSVQSRHFVYEDTDGLSSGVLLRKPHVYMHYSLASPYLEIDREVVSSVSDMGFSTDGHIEYLRVLEETGPTTDSNPSCVTEYSFLSASDFPFSEYYNSSTIGIITADGWNFTSQDLGSDYVDSQMHKGSIYAGMPSGTKIYSVNNAGEHLQYSKSLSYSTYHLDSDNELMLPSAFHCDYYERYCSLESVYRTKVTETRYGSDGSPITSKVSEITGLNTKGRPVRITASDSRGRTVLTSLSFLPQVPTFLTEKTLSIEGIVSESTRYGYSIFDINGNSIYLPSSINRGILSENGTISGYEPVLTVDSYDSYGNITRTHDSLGNSVSYIWGYNGLYPISMTTSTSDYSGLVTSWTAKPLVGITSETAPNGIITNYLLDSFGRLRGVSENGDSLGRCEYNIVNFEK